MFSKRNRKHVLRVIGTLENAWENSKKHFSFSKISIRVSITRTQYGVFYFLTANHTSREHPKSTLMQVRMQFWVVSLSHSTPCESVMQKNDKTYFRSKLRKSTEKIIFHSSALKLLSKDPNGEAGSSDSLSLLWIHRRSLSSPWNLCRLCIRRICGRV